LVVLEDPTGIGDHFPNGSTLKRRSDSVCNEKE
jgi:hypothetical protein